MQAVKVRNITIGEGVPNICVPIVGTTKEDILAEAGRFKDIPADVAEWRADWFEDIFQIEKAEDVLKELRIALGDIPLLFTFRTKKEGGERAIEAENYKKLNEAVIKSGCADLIDVELFIGEEVVKDLIVTAHANGLKVVASNHDFEKTPDRDTILGWLCRMQELGADIPKIAVMPRCKKDVLTLLSATEEMTDKYADRPIITMSMSGTGVISRLCGEVFGSALTFGSAGKASAPGQMDVKDLKQTLEVLHKSL